MAFDLTTAHGVHAYLERTSFAASSVQPLAGGSANFTYRITLRQPHTLPDLDAPVRSLVIKHAQPYVALNREIPFDTDRQRIEVRALQLVPELVGPVEHIGTPKVFHDDRQHNVMFIEDSGPDSSTLKSLLRSGPFPDHVARKIGTAIGTFIGRLHAATHSPVPGAPARLAKEALATNSQTRAIIASYYYGGILPCLTKPLHTSSSGAPPLDLPPETVAKLDAFSRREQERVRTSDDVILMGDFWTGNILVVLAPEPCLTVIDWENVRSGFAGQDIGQCLAELHLIRAFHPECGACVDVVVSAFLTAYRAIILGGSGGDHSTDNNAERRLVETAYDAAGRVGMHLIVIASTVPWGSSKVTREVVGEGVEYILRVVDRDEAWLRKSIVGGLLG